MTIQFTDTLGPSGRTESFWTYVSLSGVTVQGDGSIYAVGSGELSLGSLMLDPYAEDNHPDLAGQQITHVSLRIVMGDASGTGYGDMVTNVGSDQFLPPHDSINSTVPVGNVVVQDFVAELATPVVFRNAASFGGLVFVGYDSGGWLDPYIHIQRIQLGVDVDCCYKDFVNTAEICGSGQPVWTQLKVNLKGTVWSSNDDIAALSLGDESLLSPEQYVSGALVMEFSEFFSAYFLKGPRWDTPFPAPYDFDLVFDVSAYPGGAQSAPTLSLGYIWSYDAIEVVVSASEDGVTWTEIGSDTFATDESSRNISLTWPN